LCLPSLVVSAVALSPSHWGWLRLHFALNQGTLTLTFIFPHRFTLAVLLSTSLGLRFVPILRWLFDCRNTATSLLAKKIPKKTPLFLLRCLGVFFKTRTLVFQFNIFWISFHKNFIESEKNKKINKKKVKVSSGFKKRKFKPYGFSKKSPPYF
jgi:hypothetical protein